MKAGDCFVEDMALPGGAIDYLFWRVTAVDGDLCKTIVCVVRGDEFRVERVRSNVYDLEQLQSIPLSVFERVAALCRNTVTMAGTMILNAGRHTYEDVSLGNCYRRKSTRDIRIFRLAQDWQDTYLTDVIAWYPNRVSFIKDTIASRSLSFESNGTPVPPELFNKIEKTLQVTLVAIRSIVQASEEPEIPLPF